jgi:rhodanese-related sulfurtransferase
MPGVPELSPTEFVARWPNHAGGGDVVLLDVREHDELAIAAVQSALHIPMRESSGPACGARPRKPLVVMCHSGGRSRRVAEFLKGNGFPNVFNLMGGIDAWSAQIDSRIPRY